MSKGDKQRVVIIGLGDTGFNTAIFIHKSHSVTVIGPRPYCASGIDLGGRLAHLPSWKAMNVFQFGQSKGLDKAKVVQAVVTGVDTTRQVVTCTDVEGKVKEVPYDALVVASGVVNGFWRPKVIETLEEANKRLEAPAEQIRQAKTIAIIGAGAAGFGAAISIAGQYPDKSVHLFAGSQVLPRHHENIRKAGVERLAQAKVVVHMDTRATVPDKFDLSKVEGGTVKFSKGDVKSFDADVILWTIGATKPNSEYLPKDVLTEGGFVRVDKYLRVVPNGKEALPNVFAVGDVADSDKNRSTARTGGNMVVACNVNRYLGTSRGCTSSSRGEAKLKEWPGKARTEYAWGLLYREAGSGKAWVATDTGKLVGINAKLYEKVVIPLAHALLMKGFRSKPKTI